MPARPRPDQLTAIAVRAAAQRLLDDGGTPPPGLGQSLVQDVWIDLGDGDGPRPFPPKVILWLATGGALPKKYGYATDGPWRQQLSKLGFPVLPKGARPRRGRDCRGIDLAGQPSAKQSALRPAQPLPHVAAYSALTAAHLNAAMQRFASEAIDAARADTYAIWSDGRAYPFWRVFRAALAMTGGAMRRPGQPKRGYQPEHDRVRKLGFEVLPRGLSPVAKAEPDLSATEMPPLSLVTTSALERAAGLIETVPEFWERRQEDKYALWVNGRGPYPIKAMCLLAFHSLGLGWHEAWSKGGTNSAMDRHLRGLPGVQIAPTGQVPDADGGRARSLAEDLDQIARRKLGPTTRQRLVDARLGQGRFRKDLERHWGGACAVTGVTVREALRASHIVPWADPKADDDMRLNPHNGLLLVATLDALFDQGWISFDNGGALLVHRDISPAQRKLLGLDDPARALRNDKGLQAMSDERRDFLKMHRAKHGYPDCAS